MALMNSVKKFAGDNTDIYEAVKDYYFHYMAETRDKKLGAYDASVSLATKEDKMTKAFFAEIERVSNYKFNDKIDLRIQIKNPTIAWATNVVMATMIDSVLPDTIIRTTGLYTAIDTVGFGEAKQYDIAPNSLYTVSEGSNSRRKTLRQKDFKTSVSLSAVNHTITVGTSLYKVMCGEESIAEYMRKAILAMQTEITKDAYGALIALVEGGTFPTQLKKTGYTADKLVELCETVTAYNGSRATIIGTTRGLMKIMPDQLAGYRINTPSDNMSIQLIKNFLDYDIMVLPQVPTGRNYGLALKDDGVYIMSTGADKIIKGVIEGTDIVASNDHYDTADLTSDTTFNKRWNFQAITNATMGVLKFE